ncbi:MAG TPA: type II secretion system F family protein [Gammaproteobacteria bacterium]|nr:type II secretion system F family protein [Gammaproteobacteria bacterium]
MPHFEFKGRDARGELVSSRLEADSIDAVANQLMNSGITPLEIEPYTPRVSAREQIGRFLGAGRPTTDDLVLFCRQMYTLARAGVPIIRALTGLRESTRSPVMAEALDDIIDSLESGRDLAGSLARHPAIFSPLFVNVVRVGENSGRLEESFLRLYEYLGFEQATRKRVKVALRYPAFVVFAVAVAIVVIMWIVVPPFAQVFSSMGAQLPLPTRIIIGISNFFVHYWYVPIAVIAGAAYAARRYVRTERGRYRWDRLKFRIPVVGSIMLRSALARFARAFSMSYRSGVPLIQALSLVGRAADNEYLRERVNELRSGVERGEAISRIAATTGLFTPMVLQMMAVGEETGAIDDMMQEVAEFYERDVAYDVENLAAVLEPILIVAVGCLVLLLALAVFLPMWDLYNLAASGA